MKTTEITALEFHKKFNAYYAKCARKNAVQKNYNLLKSMYDTLNKLRLKEGLSYLLLSNFEEASKNDYFVYQNWTDEKLYSKGLSREQADQDFNALNRLIESGCCGDGCACIGRLSEPTDHNVAKRLGLIK